MTDWEMAEKLGWAVKVDGEWWVVKDHTERARDVQDMTRDAAKFALVFSVAGALLSALALWLAW